MSESLNWEEIGKQLFTEELENHAIELQTGAYRLVENVRNGDDLEDSDLEEIQHHANMLFLLLEVVDAAPRRYNEDSATLLEAMEVDR